MAFFLTAGSRKISPPPLNSFFRGYAENAHGLRIMPAVQAVAGLNPGGGFCFPRSHAETTGRHYFGVAERSHPGVGEEATPGYPTRAAMRARLWNHLELNRHLRDRLRAVFLGGRVTQFT
jgi:hypothetical protein